MSLGIKSGDKRLRNKVKIQYQFSVQLSLFKLFTSTGSLWSQSSLLCLFSAGGQMIDLPLCPHTNCIQLVLFPNDLLAVPICCVFLVSWCSIYSALSSSPNVKLVLPDRGRQHQKSLSLKHDQLNLYYKCPCRYSKSILFVTLILYNHVGFEYHD